MAPARRKKNVRLAATQDPIALAACVSDQVQIHDVRLVRSHSNCHPAAFRSELEVRFSHAATAQVPREPKSIVAVVVFKMSATRPETAEPAPVVEVSATYVLTYSLGSTDGLTKDHYSKFAQHNATYNAWPFWREFLQNTLVRMGLPPLTLPVFRIGAAADASNSENVVAQPN